MEDLFDVLFAIAIVYIPPLVSTAIICLVFDCTVSICFWLCFFLNMIVIYGVVKNG